MNSKRTRPKEIKVRLSQEELDKLNNDVKQIDFPREKYLRSLINGFIPRGKPIQEYLKVLKELNAIGNNMNQIAVVANKNGSIDVMKYKEEVKKLKLEIAEIKRLASQPFLLEEIKDGNNSDMGCEG